jgi:hypothetical protein
MICIPNIYGGPQERDIKASRQIHYEKPLVKGYPRILEISTTLIVKCP